MLKEAIKNYLSGKGFAVVDVGTGSAESCDYPVFAAKVCREVVSGGCEKGILVCGTGIGMSIAANKIKGIRAAVCTECYGARFTRAHNDANVLCLGQRITGEGLAFLIADVFLETPFEGGRHEKRIGLISELENHIK